MLIVPHWLLTLSFSIWPAFAITGILRRHRLRRRRAAANQCVVCGYDLRATPQRCPECGNVPATIQPDSVTAAAVVETK
jgi:hypothetical protein